MNKEPANNSPSSRDEPKEVAADVTYSVVIADDDPDDCLLFKEGLDELQFDVSVKVVNNGVELLSWLRRSKDRLPDVIFLDLNMPQKTGYECLSDIKKDPFMRQLPVIILSNSYEPEVVELLYERGAFHYVQKPDTFPVFKSLIHQALLLVGGKKVLKPSRDQFFLQPNGK